MAIPRGPRPPTCSRAARRDLSTSAGAAPNGPGRCLVYACNTDGAARVSTGFVGSVVGLELASLARVASGLGSPRSIAKVVESESDYSKGTSLVARSRPRCPVATRTRRGQRAHAGKRSSWAVEALCLRPWLLLDSGRSGARTPPQRVKLRMSESLPAPPCRWAGKHPAIVGIDRALDAGDLESGDLGGGDTKASTTRTADEGSGFSDRINIK